jgi:hypothetical protein
MCWVGNITDKKVAKTDIEVQKVLMMSDNDVDRFLSPYRYEVYTANEEKKHTIEVRDDIVDEFNEDIIRIDVGLHSYSRKCKCKIKNIQRKPLEGDFVMRFLTVYPKNHDKSKLFGSIFSILHFLEYECSPMSMRMMYSSTMLSSTTMACFFSSLAV